MKVEWRTVLGCVGLPGCDRRRLLGASRTSPTETAGVVMLIFGFAAYAMLFGYLLLQYMRRHRSPGPRTASTPPMRTAKARSATFPSASIWPAGMGLGHDLRRRRPDLRVVVLDHRGDVVLRRGDRLDGRIRVRGPRSPTPRRKRKRRSRPATPATSKPTRSTSTRQPGRVSGRGSGPRTPVAGGRYGPAPYRKSRPG